MTANPNPNHRLDWNDLITPPNGPPRQKKSPSGKGSGKTGKASQQDKLKNSTAHAGSKSLTPIDRARAYLQHLDPSQLSYEEWLKVGMVLFNEGGTANDWDEWSRKDISRYAEGLCESKWRGFGRNGDRAVRIGTLVHICKLYRPDLEFLLKADGVNARGFDVDATLVPKDIEVDSVCPSANIDIPPPTFCGTSKEELVRYLDLMFKPEEFVGYVSKSWTKDGKVMPQKGIYTKTAEKLKKECEKYHDLGFVIGDTDPAVGAWIRINPLDGNGCSDENVTAYRHALLESDEGDLVKQYAIIKKLKIPCTCIVHSGGKSIHALVKVDAPDYDTYRQRVNVLYEVAQRAGIKVDTSNRNPSRLSRLPGVTRNGCPQYIIEGKCGCSSWEEWEQEVLSQHNKNDLAPVKGPERTEIERQVEAREGRPYFCNEKGVLTSISEAYWAGLFAAENIALYEPTEREFYRYCAETGLYLDLTSALIKTEIAKRILMAAENWGQPGLVKKRNDGCLRGIVAHLYGQLEHRDAFSKKDRPPFIHLANGVIEFIDGNPTLKEFSPEYRSRNQSPIAFNPKATCDRFLNELVCPAVHEDDVLLLQKFAGMFLLGENIIQRMIILDGTPGGGKSQFCLVMQSLIGKINCSELRTQHLSERFEIYRFLKKSLLYGPDVHANFLNTKGASRLKSLVGGDLLDAECKGSKASFQVEGRFNVLVTSNARQRVHLEGDILAWKRRLAIVRYENPPPKKKIPDFARLLIDTEGPGILNWAILGLRELLKDIADTGDIRMTERQTKIVDSLLAESDSLRVFLRDQVLGAPGSSLTVKQITEAYAAYCPSRGWNPLPITVIHRQLDELMLELFHVSKSNSCGDSSNERGFRGVRFADDRGLI